MIGVIPTEEALELSKNSGFDLVEVSPTADPPVCKALDFGKYKYQLQKKEHEKRKNQKVVQIKEIKLRPTIDEHDYQVKLRSVHKFLESGDKVKISLRFRGREITHQDVALDIFKRIESDVEMVGKVEVEPKLEGRQMLMILSPKN